jgi:hypothetical protein
MRGNWLNVFGSPHGRRHECSRARLQDLAAYFLGGYGGSQEPVGWAPEVEDEMVKNVCDLVKTVVGEPEKK